MHAHPVASTLDPEGAVLRAGRDLNGMAVQSEKTDVDGRGSGLAASAQGVGQLVRALEREVIPRLAQAHRVTQAAAGPLSAAVDAPEVHSLVTHLLEGRTAEVHGLIAQLRRRGMSVSCIYLELLAPAARSLGTLWDHDLCDFSGVTVALGRLQRLLHDMSPEFSLGDDTPRHTWRVLLAQPPQEQHSFGLSMVAEFFRREGWVVEGGVGTAALDPAARAQTDWFDVVGFSVGSQDRLEWLRQKIAAVRSASRNPALVVMAGGPLFSQQDTSAHEIGADAVSRDASQAPLEAAMLVAAAQARAAPHQGARSNA